MTNILENEVFISMVSTIFAWIVFYFFVYFIAVAQGLQKDIIRNAFNLTAKMGNIASAFKTSVEREEQIPPEKAIQGLRKIKHQTRRTCAILQVYLLEEKENLDVKAALSRVSRMDKECGDVAKALRVGSETNLEKELEDVIKLASEANGILGEVIRQREDDKLHKI